MQVCLRNGGVKGGPHVCSDRKTEIDEIQTKRATKRGQSDKPRLSARGQMHCPNVVENQLRSIMPYIQNALLPHSYPTITLDHTIYFLSPKKVHFYPSPNSTSYSHSTSPIPPTKTKRTKNWISNLHSPNSLSPKTKARKQRHKLNDERGMSSKKIRRAMRNARRPKPTLKGRVCWQKKINQKERFWGYLGSFWMQKPKDM